MISDKDITVWKEEFKDSNSANNKQHGGGHYKMLGNFQPWDAVIAWNLGYLEGTALKYIARWKNKGGVEDIKKAIHFLEKLLEVEASKNVSSNIRATGRSEESR